MIFRSQPFFDSRHRHPTPTTGTKPDPLEQSQEAAQALLAEGTVRFSFHFRPCAKKNETQPIRIASGRRVFWKVAPTRRCVAHEEAIAALALVELAWARGKVSPQERDFFRELAARRADQQISASHFATLLTGLRARHARDGIPFGRDMVRLSIVEHVGKKAGEDWLDVRVSFLEARPTGKRTGLGHDLLNLEAIVADAVRGVLVEDDDQVVELEVRRSLS